MLNKKVLYILAAAVSISCAQKETPQVVERLSVGGIIGDKITVESDFSSSSFFDVEATVDWTASINGGDWLELVPSSGNANVKYEAALVFKSKNIAAERSAKVTLTAGSKTYSFTAVQKAYDPEEKGYDNPCSIKDGHPFLLASGDDFRKIRENVSASPMLRVLHNYAMRYADLALELEPCVYEVKDSRMLTTVAEILKRLFYLSYAYRSTGNPVYAARAERELLTICAFPDWREVHFLECAELMLGASIAYDWCYPRLSVSTRSTVIDNIRHKGLDKYFGWEGASNNWNQVCNGCAMYAACLFKQTEPKLYQDVMARATDMVKIAMAGYNPDGTYIEGPGYWCYGTSFNVLLLDLLQREYGDTRGLLDAYPSFLKTADYANAVVTPSFRVFTYSDQAFPAQISIVPFYIYDLKGDSKVLSLQKSMLEKSMLNLEHFRHERLLPAALVFAARRGIKTVDVQNAPKYFIGNGETPVASLRGTSYIAMKLGQAGTGHGHMDCGTFCFESDGVQWSADMGGEVYGNLETAGVDLWNYSQNSDRWKVLRCGPRGHSILMFDEKEQTVKKEGVFVANEFSNPLDMSVTADLSALYDYAASSVNRKIALKDGRVGEVTDKIKVGPAAVILRWNMVTEASSIIFDATGASLGVHSGAKARMTVEGLDSFSMKEWSNKPLWSCESANSQRIIGFTSALEAGKEYTIRITLTPIK